MTCSPRIALVCAALLLVATEVAAQTDAPPPATAPSQPAPSRAAIVPGEATAADEAGRRRRARALGEEALRHFDGGAWELAVQGFADADATFPAPTFRLHTARALVRLGRLLEADAAYASAIAMELPADASDVLIEARETARRERQELAMKTPTLSLVFYASRPVAAAIDGVATSASGAHRLDPGRHRIAVTTREGGVVRRDVVLRLGERRTETFDLAGTAHGAASAPGATQRTVGIVALGVGAAGFTAWGVTGAIALAEAPSHGCDGARCASSEDELATLQALRTTSTVSFYAGAAVAATGLVLVLSAPTADGDVSVGLSGSGVRARGRF